MEKRSEEILKHFDDLMYDMTQTDPHHCHCFQITSLNSKIIFKMKQTGFKKQILEEPRGQIFSTTKRLDEYAQIHFKVLQDGTIESEIEYPPDYPIAHLNSTHSYSAHKETEIILDHFSIPYKLKRIPPTTCIKRKIIKAIKPSHWTTVLGALVVVGVTIGILYTVSKSRR